MIGEKKIPLVEFLEKNREDRAVMAHLRRGLGKKPGTALEMLPYICPFLEESDRPLSRDAKFLIAALFASHNESTSKGNMGNHFGGIWLASQKSDSVELRFQALLNSHVDSLHYHLRQAIGLAKSKDIAINWHRLYDDITRWDHPDKYVQQRWARNFWAESKGERETNEQTNQ